MALKKTALLIITLLLSSTGLMFGCATVYDKMQLELEAEQIVLYLNADDILEKERQATEDVANGLDSEPILKEYDEEGNLFSKSTAFEVRVTNIPDNILDGVTHEFSNHNIVSLVEESHFKGTTNFKITALQAGNTNITFTTEEGGKQKTVSISVIERIEGIEINQNYKASVLVNELLTINTANALNFYPSTTNEKDVTFELAENYTNATITEQGQLMVTEKLETQEFVSVIVTSAYNSSFSVTIDFKVINPIKEEDLTLTTDEQMALYSRYLAQQDGGVPEGEEELVDIKPYVESVLLATNDQNNNIIEVLANVESEENFNIIFAISGQENFEVTKLSDNRAELVALTSGTSYLVVRVEIVDYEEHYIEKLLPIECSEFATVMNVNDQSHLYYDNVTLNLFDTYLSGLGLELALEVGPIGAYDKRISFNIAEEDQEKVQLRYSDGTIIPAEEINTTILNRSMSVYLTALETTGTISLEFIAYQTINATEPVSTTLTFDLKKGVEQLVLNTTDLSIEVGQDQQLIYAILPAGAAANNIELEIFNEDVLIGNESTYTITGKAIGFTRVRITADNGVFAETMVEVYNTLETVLLTIDSYKDNSNVASSTYGEDLSIYGTNPTLQDAIIAVGSGLPLNMHYLPENSTITNTIFVSDNPSIININDSGYMVAAGLGSANISVTFTTKVLQDEFDEYGLPIVGWEYKSKEVSFTKTFTISTYIPVRDIALSEIQLEIYEQNSLGYYEKQENMPTLTVQIDPVNASILEPDANPEHYQIIWSTDSGQRDEDGNKVPGFLTITSDGTLSAAVPFDQIIDGQVVDYMPNGYIYETASVVVKEHNRFYSQTATIKIKRATKVENIIVENVTNDYIYFDARESYELDGFTGLYNNVDGENILMEYDVNSYAYPAEATNNTLIYKYIHDNDDINLNPVFSVDENGNIIALRPGVAKLHIIAEDSYFTADNYAHYTEITVKIADGKSQDTALEIYDVNDLLEIDSENELTLHYVLANNIDMTGATFESLGIIDGVVYEFTGSLSGLMIYGEGQDDYKQFYIKNININNTGSNLDEYTGLFAINSGLIKNLIVSANNFETATTNTSLNSNLYAGVIAGINKGTITNCEVNIKNASLTLASENSYVGGLVGINQFDGTIDIALKTINTDYASGLVQNNAVSGVINTLESGAAAAGANYYVGGLVGQNESGANIKGFYNVNLQGSGDLNPDYSNVLYEQEGMNSFASITTNTMINFTGATGGIVGLNNGTLDGVATDATINGYNNTGGVAGINAGVVINSYSSSVVEGNNNVGGLIGAVYSINLSTPQVINNSVEFYDRLDSGVMGVTHITGVNNVGGLIGVGSDLNEFNHNYVYSYFERTYGVNFDGDIVLNNTTDVTNFAVGGLIGTLNGNGITLNKNYASLIIASTNPLDASANVYAGGLIGVANKDTAITNSYSKGLVSIQASNTYAGGLIGFVNVVTGDTASVSKTYSTAITSASTIGALIGYVEEDAAPINLNANLLVLTLADNFYLDDQVTVYNNDFGTATLDADLKLNANYTNWNLTNEINWYEAEGYVANSVDWYQLEGMLVNEGYPVLTNYEDNDLLISQAPDSIAVAVNENFEMVDDEEVIINDSFIKIDDSRAVLFLKEDANGIDPEDNYYSLNDIITTTVTPATPKTTRLYVTSSDNSIVSVLANGQIQINSEGTVTLTVSSLLNKNINTSFEVAVIKGITSFDLSDSADYSTGQLDQTTSASNPFEVKINTAKLIYSSLGFGQFNTSDNIGLLFETTDTLFTVNNLDLTTSIPDIFGNNYTGDLIGDFGSRVVYGNSSSSDPVLLSVTPYLMVDFNDTTHYVMLNDTLVSTYNLKKDVSINVFEGASTVYSDVSSAVMGLRDDLILKVYLETDKVTDDLTITGGAFEDGTDMLDYATVTPIGGAVTVNLDGVDYEEFAYRIKANQDYLNSIGGQSNFKSEIIGDIIFTAESNPNVNITINLTMIPQDLLRIDATHYPASQMQWVDDQFVYYPKELPSNIIAPGQPGIMKINLFPEYADIDYYQITSSTNGLGQFISFEQVALLTEIDTNALGQEEKTIQYISLNPSPELIQYGTKLNLISSIVTDQYGTTTQPFDGTLYVKTLIGSNVEIGDVFTVTVAGYRYDEEGNAVLNLSKQVELKAESLPGVNIFYNGSRSGQIARGTTVPLDVVTKHFDEGQVIITNPTINRGDYDEVSGEFTYEDRDLEGNVITVTDPNYYYVNVVEPTEDDPTWYLDVGPAVPSGSTFTLIAEVSRTINGIEETSYSMLDIQVVDYLVDGIEIERSGGSSDSPTINMYVGSAVPLGVEFNTTDMLGVINATAKLKAQQIVQMEIDYTIIQLTSAGTIKDDYDALVNDLSAINRSVLEYDFSFNAENLLYTMELIEDADPDNYATNPGYIQASEEYNLIQQRLDELTLFANNIAKARVLSEMQANNSVYTWYYRQTLGSITVDDNLNESTSYNEFDFDKQDGGLYVIGKNVSNTANLVTKLEYFYDNAGNVKVIVRSEEDNSIVSRYIENVIDGGVEEVLATGNFDLYSLEKQFNLNIVTNSTLDKPIPVYTVEDLRSMEAGSDYILLNDEEAGEELILENWVPLDTAIASLDGNNRTITINSFSADKEAGAYSFGLFGTISENTSIKNIKVNVQNLEAISAEEFDEVNFGVIAGVNEGVISNSEVIAEGAIEKNIEVNTKVGASTNIALLAGINSGYISNSRVGRQKVESDEYVTQGTYNPIGIQAKGTVAGFVATNNAIITSSYVDNLNVNNLTAEGSSSLTAGFAAVNGEDGKITYSYVKGISETMVNRVIQDGYVKSTGTIGGFVHTNEGIINDAFSNIPIDTQNRAGGFVYSNLATGEIKNAYSSSKITINLTSQLPFVGSNNLDQLLNTGVIETSYYLQNSNYYANQIENYPAIGQSFKDFGKVESFTGFSFLTEEGYAENSVWEWDGDDNQSPTLQTANNFAISERKLVSEELVDGEITSYFYDTKEGRADYGSYENPKLISNVDQFLDELTNELYLFEIDDQTINYQHLRLIKDIDFANLEPENQASLEKLQTITFAGGIDGNGMNLNNLNILSASGTGGLESFGLFRQIGLNDFQDGNYKNNNQSENATVIKNLNINVLDIAATDSEYVGVLSGVIKNSVIMNVSIYGEDLTVQGKNIVGGLAGKVLGNSRIININSNVSVSAEYRTTDMVGQAIDYSYYNEYGKDDTQISYAGGIAGVIDLYVLKNDGERVANDNFEGHVPKVLRLHVEGYVKIRAEHSGGVVGYVGSDTYIKDAFYKVEYDQDEVEYQAIVGYNTSGGITSENLGKLDHIRIEHDEDYQLGTIDVLEARRIAGIQDLFKETGEYVGALIGYNNNGTIIDSFARIDIVNEDIKIAGGVIGINYGGSFERVITTSHIDVNHRIGGFIGQQSDSSLEDTSAGGPSSGADLTINSCFAINNWQVRAYDLPDEVDSMGSFIGYMDAGVTIDYTDTFIDDEGATVANNSSVKTVYETIDGLQGSRTLNEIGNSSDSNSISDSTYDKMTDFTNEETLNRYLKYVESEPVYWTLTNEKHDLKYARLIFSNLQNDQEITNQSQLENVASNPYGIYRITQDIMLDNTFNFIPNFKGVMVGIEKLEDGELPTIYGLELNESAKNLGLFGEIEGATLANFNINVKSITNTYNDIDSGTGAIAGSANGSSIINVDVEFESNLSEINATTESVGGLIGNVISTTLTGANLGVVAPDNVNIIANGTGALYDTLYVGGAVGKGSLRGIFESEINGNVTATSENDVYVGGAVGYADYYAVEQLDTDVNITATAGTGSADDAFVGGVIGAANNLNVDAEQLTAAGTITINEATDVYVGGIVGDGKMQILQNSYYVNNDAVSISVSNNNTNAYIGGIAGQLTDTTVEDVNAQANIETKDNSTITYVGGLFGKIKTDYRSINNVYATGSIEVGKSYDINTGTAHFMGGIIGLFDDNLGHAVSATLNKAYSDVDISSYTSNGLAVYMGGIVGAQYLEISNTMAVGDLRNYSNSFSKVGGLAGYNSAGAYSIASSLALVQIYTEYLNGATVGSIVGQYSGSGSPTYYSYYDEDISLTTVRQTDYGVGKDAIELMDGNFPSGFGGNWVNTIGIYPYLDFDAIDTSEGTKLNPNRVTSATGFNSIEGSNEYFVQMNDIDESINSINTISNFNGFYNGQGHTIQMDNQEVSSGSGYSLFTNITSDAVIANLVVKTIINITSIKTNVYASPFVRTNNGYLFKTFADGKINAPSGVSTQNSKLAGLVVTNNGYVIESGSNVDLDILIREGASRPIIGGLIAENLAGYVNHTFTVGKIEILDNSSNSVTVGGLIGYIDDGKIYNSYSSSLFDSIFVDLSYVGGIWGDVQEGNTNIYITNVYHDYYATKLNDSFASYTKDMAPNNEDFAHRLAGTTYLDNDIQNKIWEERKTFNYGYPMLRWLYLTSLDLSTGSGTFDNPFEIHHAGRLDWIRTSLSVYYYYEQTEDIDIKYINDNSEFAPIGAFVGYNDYTYSGSTGIFYGAYDGQGHFITNLNQEIDYSKEEGENNLGLFREINGLGNSYGLVYNLKLGIDFLITNSSDLGDNVRVGAIASKIQYAEIKNCTIFGEIDDFRNSTLNNDSGLLMGSVAGYVYSSSIEKVESGVDISANGGIVGGIAGSIIDSSLDDVYFGTVTPYGPPITGSLDYEPEQTITNLSYVGGIVGQSTNSDLYNVYNSNIIDITPLHTDDTTKSKTDAYGGIVGYMNGGTLTLAKNTGKVDYFGVAAKYDGSHQVAIGGIAGRINGEASISHAINEGELEVDFNYNDIVVGGVIGLNGIYKNNDDVDGDANLIRLNNKGVIDVDIISSGRDLTPYIGQEEIYVGGIMGMDQTESSAIGFSSNTGAIDVTGSRSTTIGGIVGYTESIVTNVYNSSSATITFNSFSSSLSNSRTFRAYIGGIMGHTYGTAIYDSFNEGNLNIDASTVGDYKEYSSRIGGLAGYSDVSAVGSLGVYDSYVEANISLTNDDNDDEEGYVGGILGYGKNKIIRSYVKGDITANDTYTANLMNIGGIVGYGIDSDIDIVYYYGTIQDWSDNVSTGKIIGYADDGDIYDSYYGPTQKIGEYTFRPDPQEDPITVDVNMPAVGSGVSYYSNALTNSNMADRNSFNDEWDFTAPNNDWEGATTSEEGDEPTLVDVVKEGGLTYSEAEPFVYSGNYSMPDLTPTAPAGEDPPEPIELEYIMWE